MTFIKIASCTIQQWVPIVELFYENEVHCKTKQLIDAVGLKIFSGP